MYALHTNIAREFLSRADFIDFRFDLSVAIFPSFFFLHLKKKSLPWRFDCMPVHRQIAALVFCLSNRKIKRYQLQKTHTEHRRPRAVIRFNPTVKESKQIKCSNTKQCKKSACSLGNEKQFVPQDPSMKSLLRSVTSQWPFFLLGNSSVDQWFNKWHKVFSFRKVIIWNVRVVCDEWIILSSKAKHVSSFLYAGREDTLFHSFGDDRVKIGDRSYFERLLRVLLDKWIH